MIAEEPVAPRPQVDRLRVLFVGRLVYYKGIEVLLDAIEGHDRFEVTIVGDGSLRESIRERVAASAELSKQVTLIHGASERR